ncbi:DUF4058 family protein [Tautonia plasticadhaerens]|uniref:DUF4058 domain-containing protein n=1 Tax=Tautonia plasticadhaerens TaxID=2527974 RepID=A0A518H2Q2_9BACT|nr:DUF4058 family protein [Tautonia plasticadhaerens]QDV35100.1 hypothetical protein ElP_30020 [Tautonia plasticadhaerens]
MPVHDWTRVGAGTFHAFHTAWIGRLMEALNGILPAGYYAMAEQHAGAMIADILTLHEPGERPDEMPDRGPVAVAVAPPRIRHRLLPSPMATYRQQRKTVAVRHASGHRLVALIEIASPSNKDRPKSVEEFAGKVVSALEAGIHVLLVDLLPPGPHDPNGLHGAIWSDFGDEQPIEPGLPLTLASYVSPGPGRLPEAYVEPIGVGSPMPEMPLFLDPDSYINTPLEPTYEASYRGMPAFWREVIEGLRESDRA